MSQQGGSGAALAAAREALAARDIALAEADRALVNVLAAAHDLATDAIGRLDAINAEVDSVEAVRADDSGTGGHAVTRRLVAKTRDIASVVDDAAAASRAKAVVLRDLKDRFHPTPG